MRITPGERPHVDGIEASNHWEIKVVLVIIATLGASLGLV